MEPLNNRPQRPEEAEVRKHFGEQIPTDAPLMRPPYTTVWALQDGTLLWDWRNGYASIGEPETPENRLKCLMYISGPAGSGKSILIQSLANSTEVSGMPGDDDRGAAFTTPYEIHTALEVNRNYEIVAFTAQTHSAKISGAVERQAQIRGLRFYDIRLSRKAETPECSASDAPDLITRLKNTITGKDAEINELKGNLAELNMQYALQVVDGNAEEAVLREVIKQSKR